jgi:hypothetical protein
MKKTFTIALCVLLFNSANAADFKSVTPEVVNGMTVGWDYDYYFKSSILAPSAVVFNGQASCDRPIVHSTGKPLLPVPFVCFKSEAEARAEAQKEADQFEVNCRNEPTCSTFKIAAKHLKQKLGIQ